MALRNPTNCWIERRKNDGHTTYRVRWFDTHANRVASEACGDDYALARERRTQIRLRIRNKLLGTMPDVEIEVFIDALGSLMAGKAPDTIEKTKGTMTLLKDKCKVRFLGDVTRRAVMDFRSKRLIAGLSPATVNKDLRQTRSALSYAVDAGMLEINPLLRWKGLMVREPENRVRVVEEVEFGAMMALCGNPDFRALLLVAYRQGLRRTELCNLRWSAVDLGRQLIYVVNVPEAGEFTKSRKNRCVPMDQRVHAMLTDMLTAKPKIVDDGGVRPKWPYVFTWPDGDRFKADWVTHEFTRLVKRAKLASCTLHDLRRSFSTLAQRAGVDRDIVKDLGGWSAVSVVEKHYTGDLSPAYRTAMDQIAEHSAGSATHNCPDVKIEDEKNGCKSLKKKRPGP